MSEKPPHPPSSGDSPPPTIGDALAAKQLEKLQEIREIAARKAEERPAGAGTQEEITHTGNPSSFQETIPGDADGSFHPRSAMKVFEDAYFDTAAALRAQGIEPANIPEEWELVWKNLEAMRKGLRAYDRTSGAKQTDIAKRMNDLSAGMRAAKEKVLREASKQKNTPAVGPTQPIQDVVPETVSLKQGEIPPDVDPDFNLLSDEARERAQALREQLLPGSPGAIADTASRTAVPFFAPDSFPKEKPDNSENPTEKIRELRERLTALEAHMRSGSGVKGDSAGVEQEMLGLENEIRATERAAVAESGTPAESRQKLRNLLEELEKVPQGGPRSMESDYSDSSFEGELPNAVMPAVLHSHTEVVAEKGGVPATMQKGAEAVPAPDLRPRMSEALETSLRAHLDSRSAELNEKAKGIGPAAEKLVRSIGERYNRLGLKKKLLIGGGLSVAALGLSIATGGASIWWTFGILSAYRAAGGAGTFVATEGLFKRSQEKQERWWNKYPKAYAATAGLLVGSGVFGKAIGAGLHMAAGTQEGEAVQRLFERMWHGGTEHAAHVAAPHYGGEATTGPTAHPQGFSGEATSGPELHTQFPQVPTVLAQTGLGYEAMAKQLTEQMHSMHFDPSQFPAGSDAARLLAAPPHDIDRVVQQIATERGYFKLGSSSVLVRPGDTLTVGQGGSLHFFDPKIATHAPYVVNDAPNGAPTTPPRPPVFVTGRAFPLPPKPPPMPPVGHLPIPPAPPPHEAVMHARAPSGTEHAPTTPEVGQSRMTTAELNKWSLSRARVGLDTPPITPPSPHETAAAAARHVGGTAGVERAAPLQPSVEHAQAFINNHGLTIDPAHGEVFRTIDGKVAAYGNNFGARFNAAQSYAFAHPGTTVWVQSEQLFPMYDDATGKVISVPWVFQVQVNAVTHTLDRISSAAPLNYSQIGSLQPETFTQELH